MASKVKIFCLMVPPSVTCKGAQRSRVMLSQVGGGSRGAGARGSPERTLCGGCHEPHWYPPGRPAPLDRVQAEALSSSPSLRPYSSAGAGPPFSRACPRAPREAASVIPLVGLAKMMAKAWGSAWSRDRECVWPKAILAQGERKWGSRLNRQRRELGAREQSPGPRSHVISKC